MNLDLITDVFFAAATSLMAFLLRECPIVTKIGRRRQSACSGGQLAHLRLAPVRALAELFDHLRLNAGRSSGLRLDTSPLSTTTSRSTQFAPALTRSVLRVGHEVIIL